MVLKALLMAYDYIDNESIDPRSISLFGIPSTLQLFVLLSAYIYFVKVFGPKFMKGREAFKIERLIIFYNIFQIIANFIVFTKIITVITDGQFSWRCEAIDYSNTPRGIYVSTVSYYFFILKMADLLDTIFFVLRKKDNQASFLHLYHHIAMSIGGWLCVRYFPGGQPIFLGLINTFVHSVMYTYYLLTALEPKYKNSIWWKKYITQMQMIQFLLIALHNTQILFQNPCSYHQFLAELLITQNFFMFYLFYGFYEKAYCSKKNTS